MDLIERADHLLHLDRLAVRAAAGRGQVALLSGPPATGRSTLLHAAAERATRQGMLVLTAAAAPLERSLPCGVLNQLLGGAPLPEAEAGPVAELLAAATRRATRGPAGDDPDADLLQLFHQLCLRLRSAAAHRPLLLAVDDVEHADDASLHFLQQLVRRLATARVLAVLTGPRQESSPAFLVELRRRPNLHDLAVGPLSEDGVRELLRRRADDATARRSAPEVFRATGGNLVLADALAAAPEEQEQAGRRYGLAFLECVRRGGPPLLAMAEALAVLGGDLARVSPAGVLDVDAAEVGTALRTMTAAGLLGPAGLRHPAAGAAVLEHAPAGRRAALHGRAAHVLWEAGAPAPVVARHLAAAGPPPPWAAPVLLQAAEHALAVDDCAEAATCLTLALQADTGLAAAATVRARLAQLEWRSDPAAAARHLPALLASLRADRLDRRDGFVLVRHLLWHGRTDEAVDALNILRSTAEPDAEAGAELRDMEAWLAYAHPPLAHRRHLSPPPDRAGPSLVTPMADPWLRAGALVAGQLARSQVGAAAEVAEQTLRDLDQGRHTAWADEAAAAALLALAHAGRGDLASQWSHRLLDHRGDGAAAATWRATLRAVRSQVALDLGDLPAAADEARAALDEVAPRAWGVAVGLPLATLVLASARLGRVEQAAAHLAHPVPAAMFQSRYALHYLYARGHFHLATRHRHAALADFLSCGELVRDWGLDAAGVVPWRSSAAEAWLLLGNPDQARRLVSDELTHDRGGTPRGRGLALRVLAAVGPVGRRTRLLTESLELLESCGDRYEQARTLADLVTAYHRVDQNRRARVVFRRALHTVRACGAEALHRELLSLGGDLGETGGVPGDSDRVAELTESESRVAALAAMGYTNREIAGKLYVTPSTVEQHLTRVYRKLRISHRRELPGDLTWRAGALPRASVS